MTVFAEGLRQDIQRSAENSRKGTVSGRLYSLQYVASGSGAGRYRQVSMSVAVLNGTGSMADLLRTRSGSAIHRQNGSFQVLEAGRSSLNPAASRTEAARSSQLKSCSIRGRLSLSPSLPKIRRFTEAAPIQPLKMLAPQSLIPLDPMAESCSLLRLKPLRLPGEGRSLEAVSELCGIHEHLTCQAQLVKIEGSHDLVAIRAHL